MHKIIYEDCIQIIKDNDMEKLRNKSFLITGASGMIGSYVANVLKVLNDDYGMNIKILLNVRDENKLSEWQIKHEKYLRERIERILDVKNEINGLLDKIKADTSNYNILKYSNLIFEKEYLINVAYS
jgi:NADP-dependent 3-hydroxy acid dehydrogenase YdfG